MCWLAHSSNLMIRFHLPFVFVHIDESTGVWRPPAGLLFLRITIFSQGWRNISNVLVLIFDILGIYRGKQIWFLHVSTIYDMKFLGYLISMVSRLNDVRFLWYYNYMIYNWQQSRCYFSFQKHLIWTRSNKNLSKSGEITPEEEYELWTF